MLRRKDMSKRNIGALRKNWVVLKQGPNLAEIIYLDVLDPEYRMGIAHIYGRRCMQNWVIDRADLQFDLAGIIKRIAKWNFIPGKARATHIDRENRFCFAQAF